MKKAIQRVIGALAVAGAGLGLAPSAEALLGTVDLDPLSENPQAIFGLTKFGEDNKYATFNVSITPFLPSAVLDITQNRGSFHSTLDLGCSGGRYSALGMGTNTVDGDRILFCPFPQTAQAAMYHMFVF
jgi:hypothetical protein